jgi:hypothetical protein
MTSLVHAFPSRKTPSPNGETDVLGLGDARTSLMHGAASLRTAVPDDETAVSSRETGLARLVIVVLGLGPSLPGLETAVPAKNRPRHVDFWSPDGKSEIGAGMSL